MRNTIASLCLALLGTACLAATDINQASEADLDGIKGIGPSLSGKILATRQQAPFTSWQDLMHRVPGIRHKSAARLSEHGLTVNGSPYHPHTGTQPPRPGN